MVHKAIPLPLNNIGEIRPTQAEDKIFHIIEVLTVPRYGGKAFDKRLGRTEGKDDTRQRP